MRNIGIDVKKVDVQPGDKHDPFSAPFPVRGQRLVGTVISTRAQRSATVLIERQIEVKKYQRFIRKRSKVRVHNPDSINAQDGDVVRVVATRPISKTKHFSIVEIIKKAGEEASAETGDIAVDVTDLKKAQEGQRRASKKKAPAKKKASKKEAEEEGE
jgi:small subunit ribosomal protein S17